MSFRMEPLTIVFAPDLATNAAGFVDDWNRTPDCREVALAEVGAAAATTYDPTLLDSGVALLSSIATGIAANMIYDRIKTLMAKRRGPAPIEIIELNQPDGTRLLIVRSGDKAAP